MKALILAGGLGTRLREETEFKPKPMVEVGGRPIIWHIMKSFSVQGINKFCIATGYKGEMIKDYFLNYYSRNNDVTVNLGNTNDVIQHGEHGESDWEVTITNTGEETPTGGRVLKSKSYIGNERFLCTYGDGLSDVDINKSLEFHVSHGRIATVTTVQPLSRFGVMDFGSDGLVNKFREKPVIEGWINAGYFIFEPEVFDFLDTNSILEQAPLSKLANQGQLAAYKHPGYWQPMDTYREALQLNELWNSKKAPWKNWN